MSNVRAIRNVGLICNRSDQFAPIGGLAPNATAFMRGPSSRASYNGAINKQQFSPSSSPANQKNLMLANKRVHSVNGLLNPFPASSGGVAQRMYFL